MKRVLITLLAVLALGLFTACNSTNSNQSPQNAGGTKAVGTADTGAESQSEVPSDVTQSSDLQNDANAQTAAANHANTPISAPSGDIVEIREKMFIAQTNDIYYNTGDYLGKTIKYEGIFDVYEAETGTVYNSVIRYGPGCCGIDANAGFEVKWEREYPDPGDWVEVVGTLEEYDEDGYIFLRVALSSLTVLQERGAEFVAQ